MVTVYVLQSQKNGTRYTGMTKDINNRLKEHNQGLSKYSKGHRPWVLIYTENHQNWKQARKREKYLKSAAGRKWLHKQLSNSVEY